MNVTMSLNRYAVIAVGHMLAISVYTVGQNIRPIFGRSMCKNANAKN